ncbi:hypothetical protein AAIG87_36045, partial [Pseudomonas aeruginosa]
YHILWGLTNEAVPTSELPAHFLGRSVRAHRYADKALLNRKMEILLGTLVTIDPVRAAVLCDTQHKD